MLKFKNLLCCTMSVILMLSLMSCSVVEKLNSHYEGDLVIDQTENVSVSETVIKALENNDADAIKNLKTDFLRCGRNQKSVFCSCQRSLSGSG